MPVGGKTKKGRAQVGIIGGSGLYQMEILKEVKEVALSTPFGKPSGRFILGTLEGVQVAFLARHGEGHGLLPSEINYRANIYGLKKLGVERILSVSAVGSMKEAIAPGDVVIPDQFYDLTKKRENSFFGRGVVAHVSLADPICQQTAAAVIQAGESVGASLHQGGVYLCMEGPQFSTRAESRIHRGWGADIIGMTNATEAKLAREAEICYVTIAVATDYDCWRSPEEEVSVEGVLKVLRQGVALSKAIIQATLRRLTPRTCACQTALRAAIITPPAAMPEKTKRELAPLIGKYIS